MDGFGEFVAFAVVARHGGFAGAGRELGLTASAVAKRVQRLETRLGIRLFHRTTRQVTLTADGEALFARCEKVLADIEDIESLASDTRGAPHGLLRISVPITYGKRVLMPRLARLLAAHPGLRLDVRLSDAYCDLVKDGVDAAVRVGTLDDSGFAARRIDAQRLVLCAGPGYLRRHGTPQRPSDLESQGFVVFRNPTSGRERAIQLQVDGAPFSLQPRARAVINDGEGMVEAARCDAGLVQVPCYMAEDGLADGSLVEVLAPFAPPAVPISLVWPGNRLLPARMRLLIDTLAADA